MGDLYGCLAIADEAKQHDLETVFLVEEHREALQLLRSLGHQYQKLPRRAGTETDVVASLAIPSDVIVVNKLRSAPAYIRALRDAKRRVVTIDDDGEAAGLANLRINPLYPTGGARTSFRYLMLRSEFQKLHQISRTTPDRVSRLLVMQGGADTHGFLPKIAGALHGIKETFDTTIVVGPAFRHQAELSRAIDSGARAINVVRTPTDLPQRMLNSDLAITAAGLTMFELACVGTPSLVICAEPFEVATAQRLEKRGAVKSLGFGRDVSEAAIARAIAQLLKDKQQRTLMARAGKRAVDGRGAVRIVELIS
jgi:spore coat polysaccharide biosynthesis predicted glycosyltransferase SpsG